MHPGDLAWQQMWISSDGNSGVRKLAGLGTVETSLYFLLSSELNNGLIESHIALIGSRIRREPGIRH
jgi:hypothetical protein